VVQIEQLVRRLCVYLHRRKFGGNSIKADAEGFVGARSGSSDGEVCGVGYAPSQKEMHFWLETARVCDYSERYFVKIWGQFASAFLTPNSMDSFPDPVTKAPFFKSYQNLTGRVW